MSDLGRQARAGASWDSDLPTFSTSPPTTVAARLADFVRDAGTSQLAAWSKDVSWLQRELSAYLARRPEAADDWTVLEYELPREFRRPDVIVLKNGCVVVHELPGYLNPTKAALREAAVYGQDLSAHRSYRQSSVRRIKKPLRFSLHVAIVIVPCMDEGLLRL